MFGTFSHGAFWRQTNFHYFETITLLRELGKIYFGDENTDDILIIYLLN
jgi:hypothetical protein